MDTIVVGVLDPMAGTCTSRMVSVRPLRRCRRRWSARPAAPGSGPGGCPSRPAARSCPCPWRADRGSRRARGSRCSDESIHSACADHCDDEHQQERQHEAAPMSFAARLFRLRWAAAVVVPPAAAGAAAGRSAAEVRDAGAVAAGAAGESAGSVATRGPAVAGSSGHAGSLATAPGAPWGRDPGACGRLSFTSTEIYDSQPRWPAANA